MMTTILLWILLIFLILITISVGNRWIRTGDYGRLFVFMVLAVIAVVVILLLKGFIELIFMNPIYSIVIGTFVIIAVIIFTAPAEKRKKGGKKK